SPIASGLLDVSLAKSFGIGYLLFPSALNKQISNASFNRGIETNQIIIETARVDVTFVPPMFSPDNPNDPARHFDQSVYAYVPPQQSATIPVDVIPAALVKTLPPLDPNNAAYAQVKVQFIGESNHTTIKSNVMKFTVNLCDGCLVRQVGACCSMAT